jgi:hypothetical protein
MAAAIAGQVAITLASQILPYAGSWVTKAIQTWGPAKVANNTIDKAHKVGQDALGGKGWLGTVGGAIGTGIGYVAAPFIATAAPTNGSINLIANVAGAIVGATAEATINHFTKKEEKPAQKPATPAELLLEIEKLKSENLRTQLELEKLKNKPAVVDAPVGVPASAAA